MNSTDDRESLPTLATLTTRGVEWLPPGGYFLATMNPAAVGRMNIFTKPGGDRLGILPDLRVVLFSTKHNRVLRMWWPHQMVSINVDTLVRDPDIHED